MPIKKGATSTEELDRVAEKKSKSGLRERFKSEKDKLDRVVTFKLKERERNAFQRYCDENGYLPSSFCRSFLVQFLKKEGYFDLS